MTPTPADRASRMDRRGAVMTLKSASRTKSIKRFDPVFSGSSADASFELAHYP
jgi:hypothetical protein